MCALFDLVILVLDICKWTLFAAVIMSWLLAFGVINRYNRGVAMVADMLYRVTEPALRPVRRVVPLMGGVDISYVVLFLLIYLVEELLYEYFFRAACVY
jgi:YggT family protein